MTNDRPTILQIIPHLDAGGAERSTVEIAQALAGSGARALVLTEGGRLSSAIVAAGGELRLFPAAVKSPARIFANARTLARLIAAESVDLIHARSRAPAWSALMAARRCGIPFVTTYHGAYGETNALKRLYNSVMARGDVVIANSRYTAGLVAQRYHTPQQRIEVIHRGVDTLVFDPARVDPMRVAALRQAWGVEPAERIVLHAARLTGWKGQSVVIEAAAALRAARQCNNVAFVFAGDTQGRDGYAEALQRQATDLGVARQVRLVGHVEDIAAAYLAAQVTVIASVEPEAFGRTAIEAAAMGCPVIATDIGAPPETVCPEADSGKDSMTGWLVPPGDAAALAERLSQALSLPAEAREHVARRARRHVLEHFTREAMQRRTLGVYDRLLGTMLEHRFATTTPQTN